MGTWFISLREHNKILYINIAAKYVCMSQNIQLNPKCAIYQKILSNQIKSNQIKSNQIKSNIIYLRRNIDKSLLQVVD